MKVLFVSSGKSGDVGYVVRNQGESLVRKGIEIEYFTIKSGFLGYIKAVREINRKFKKGGYDLVHAHYSFSAFAVTLAGCSPLVVSLMGSDARGPGIIRMIIRFLCSFRWDVTIVKTREMKEFLKLKEALIIPNGVNIDRFKPMPKDEARKFMSYPHDRKLIILISTPNRPEKNIELAGKAISALKDPGVELKHISGVPNEEIPYYINAADVILLTSKWEGSVNVIKEAMACNCPIVSTDVGDVRWVTSNTEGCFITSSEISDIIRNIKTALDFRKRTDGRQRIIQLGLDSKTVAGRLLEVYEGILKKNKSREQQETGTILQRSISK